MRQSTPLLHIDGLDVAYGDVKVLWDVSLDIYPAEIVALVGANGAGKSTLLSTISGLMLPQAGQITFDGHVIARQSPTGAARLPLQLTTQQIVDLGIVQVPEGRRLFPAMTVRDQLRLGAFRRTGKPQIEADIQRVLDLFPRLKERIDTLAGKLSGGEQQMVALGRALMARPRLLMVDELSLGLAPVIVESLVEIVKQVNADGTTILLVEQDVQTALEIATRGYVLETGHITLSGDAAALLADDRVQQAYLGTAIFQPAPEPAAT